MSRTLTNIIFPLFVLAPVALTGCETEKKPAAAEADGGKKAKPAGGETKSKPADPAKPAADKPETDTKAGEGAPDGKADAKADGKADAKADAPADAKADAKADGKADAKADGKADAKADGKADAKAADVKAAK